MEQQTSEVQGEKKTRRTRASYDVHRRTLLAQGLKGARQRLGISARDAAAQLTAHGLDCTRGTLLAWERGGGRTSREPFASDLAVVAAVYHCAVAEFFNAAMVSSENTVTNHAEG